MLKTCNLNNVKELFFHLKMQRQWKIDEFVVTIFLNISFLLYFTLLLFFFILKVKKIECNMLNLYKIIFCAAYLVSFMFLDRSVTAIPSCDIIFRCHGEYITYFYFST